MKFRKSILFVSLLTSTLFTTSCNKKYEKLSSYYHNEISSFIYVDNNELLNLANNKQDFILFLWSDCGCGGPTDSVIQTFNSYIKDTKLIIYAISSTDYQKLPISKSENFPLYPTGIEASEKIPSLYFYNDGVLQKQYTYNSDFKSIDGINNIINDNVQKNGLKSLNTLIEYSYDTYTFNKFDYSSTTYLDENINSKNISICYSWNECGDCNSLKKILKSYFENNDKALYYFEVEYFRNQNNKETLWDDENNGFPYLYGFSSYRGGKVPTIVSYANGKVKDMIVYHNDIVVNNVIQESFFKELIGKTLSEEEQENYHKDKVLEYLNSMEV